MSKHLLHTGKIERDWFGNTCPDNHFTLSASRSHLFFDTQVELAPPSAFPAQTGDYYEGLWEYDVAELFIAADKKDRYLEINLAPNGAWWLMTFSAPRQRIENRSIDYQQIKTQGTLNKASWAATLSIPHGLLQNILQTDTMHFNVTYILGNPKQYLSYSNLHSMQPDFHIPTYYQHLNSSQITFKT